MTKKGHVFSSFFIYFPSAVVSWKLKSCGPEREAKPSGSARVSEPPLEIASSPEYRIDSHLAEAQPSPAIHQLYMIAGSKNGLNCTQHLVKPSSLFHLSPTFLEKPMTFGRSGKATDHHKIRVNTRFVSQHAAKFAHEFRRPKFIKAGDRNSHHAGLKRAASRADASALS